MTEDTIRILKKGTCPSLSGKSTLTYHWGSDSENAVLLRVTANSGGGYFSQEWVPLEAIHKALLAVPENLSAVALFPLFRGKSVNTPGYLLAILRHEKLVEPMKGKQRRFRLADEAVFAEKTQLLSAPKKPPAKKKRTPRKKATPAKS